MKSLKSMEITVKHETNNKFEEIISTTDGYFL